MDVHLEEEEEAEEVSDPIIVDDIGGNDTSTEDHSMMYQIYQTCIQQVNSPGLKTQLLLNYGLVVQLYSNHWI